LFIAHFYIDKQNGLSNLSQFTPRKGVREENMRKSVISSLVTTIVANANGRLVAAGVALRTLLNHTSMRDHQCPWHESQIALEQHYFYGPIGSQSMPGSSPMPNDGDDLNVVARVWQGLKRPARSAYALCPAYAAIARVASKG
jgi:hypothetical protein